MDFKGEKVLVFGTGLSGISAAKLLIKEGAEVLLFDGNEELDCSRILENFDEWNEVRISVGELSEDVTKGIDLAIISPGVPIDCPDVMTLRARGIPVWGEVELAARCDQGLLLAITGTNGKTTTTSLLGEIMKSCGGQVNTVGNIGIPYSGTIDNTGEDSITVAEISSFQLESIDEFHPKVSAVLNITPDHLNRHHTMECYIATKMSITRNQTEEDFCVLNYEDEIIREHTDGIKAKLVWFSSLHTLDEGLYLDGTEIICSHDGIKEKVIDIDELNILGRHNHENVMAAAAMALCVGVPMENIRKVLREFKAVEHRIEFVTEKRGVRFYNDSKGTNPDAAIKGIQAMDRPTCLIGGGYDKDSEYTEWIKSFDGKVKLLVLIGQTREKIAADAEKCGFKDYVFADDLREAVDICYENAQNGDAVLLSPACASWGMFPNYEVRGKMFKEMVNALEE
ncbi:MAG: UDP-N-acetylmuramoyl-L-alanine--D-glutamate ligase [Clostridiales bacterium]|nr:UDP-N-acetylmuramoyl-L-alanine--D-glutamate ligase [Clostridiales bacterium]